MVQIFILGSSNVYGVGAQQNGWADLIKQSYHHKMYSDDGVTEIFEVFNMGKSGATIDFMKNEFPQQLKQYSREGKIITIVSVGGNNSKAVDTPNNYISSIEQYEEEVSQLLDLLKKLSSYVIAVGSGYVDESKTNPIFNPDIGGNSYFQNERMKKFESKLKELCNKKDITFIDLGVTEAQWKGKYLFKDGLHPNQEGHKLISYKVLTALEKIIK